MPLIRSIHDITKQTWVIRDRAKAEGKWRVLIIAANLPYEIASQVREFAPNLYRTIKDDAGAKSLIIGLRAAGYNVDISYRADVEGEFSDIYSAQQSNGVGSDLGLNEAVEIVPQTERYVELTGGGASLCCFREPSEIEVFNDMHSYVGDFFRVLRHPERFGKLFVMNQLIPLETALADRALVDIIRQKQIDRLSRTYCFYRFMRQPLVDRLQKMSEGHLFEHRRANEKVFDSNPDTDKLYDTLRIADAFLPDLHGRLMRMQIEKYPWEKVLEIYDSEETMFWVDPEAILNRTEGDRQKFFESLSEVKGQVAMYVRNDSLEKLALPNRGAFWAFKKLGDSKAVLVTKFR